MSFQTDDISAPKLRAATLAAAIVDLDGTLVDTLGDFVAALQRMLHDLPAPFHGYTVTADVVERMVGKGSEHLVQSLLTHIDPTAAAALQVQALAGYQRHYAEVNGHHARVYPGVAAGLQQLRARGWPLACVTNKPTAFAQSLLQHTGLAEFFAFTLGGDALPRKKPHPDPLLAACERLGHAPARTLMIGDSSNDAQAARAAGCPVLLMRYGYNHGEPVERVDADGFADALDQLPLV